MKRLLWGIVALSLVPASVLAVRRVQSEGRNRTVALVMDERALAIQADHLGITSFDLGLRYRALGLTGIALYEETIESLASRGRIGTMRGHEARTQAARDSEPMPEVPGNSTLVTELEPGALDRLLAKNTPKPLETRLGGRIWYAYSGTDTNARPAGPDPVELKRWSEAGFDIAYRPRNFPGLTRVGDDFPEEASYLVHAGLQVAGYPNRLAETVAASQTYLTAMIEGTNQDGMGAINQKVPTVRLLSFNQDHLNRRLLPDDVVEKYLLAANERGVRLLYLRPYTEERLGDMFANTERLIERLTAALRREGFRIGPLPTLQSDYRPIGWLRALAAVGVIAGLGLLGLLYPGLWGAAVASSVLGLGLIAGGLDWDALALTAALTFPILGFGYLRERLASLGLATVVSLAGAVLLAAVGSDRESMLAIRPFAGVAATLIVPPALFALHYTLRFQKPAAWVNALWNHRVRVGDVVVVTVAVGALALVFLRRGSFPVIGISSAELAVREWLSGLFVRPRFKELLGHPLAVLGLTGGGWPAWIRGALLTGGVVAQASILNSFSHYHTPLLISLERTLLALALGLALGLALVPLVRSAVWLVRRWLAQSESEGDRVGKVHDRSESA